MKKGQDVYKEVKVFEFPGMIVRVHIPDLEASERTRRMKRIHEAAAKVLQEEERVKAKWQSSR